MPLERLMLAVIRPDKYIAKNASVPGVLAKEGLESTAEELKHNDGNGANAEVGLRKSTARVTRILKP